MFGQPRSKAGSNAYREAYDKIDWTDDGPAKPGRHVKPKPGGGWDCGIKSHDHDTFAQTAACVTGEDKR
jgi:hypothetical protein